MTQDDEIQSLARRSATDPTDSASAAALARALLRMGDRETGARWAAVAVEGAIGGHGLALANELGLPLRVLPWGARSALLAVGPESATVVAELPFAHRARLLFEGRRIAAAEVAGQDSIVSVLDVGDTLSPVAGSPFEIGCFQARAVALAGRAIFVGGISNAKGTDPESAYVRDLESPGTEWRPVPMPEGARGNPIDGLHVIGTRLLALDPILTSKVLLAFDIGDPLRPALTARYSFLWHGMWGDSSAGAGWIAVLSARIDRAVRAANVIALFDPTDLGPRCHAQRRWREPKDPHIWTQVRVWGESVAIAGGRAGVGFLDLRAAEVHRDTVAEHPYGSPELPESALRYVDPGLAPDEQVLSVAGGFDHRTVVAAIGKDSVSRFVVVSAPGNG